MLASPPAEDCIMSMSSWPVCRDGLLGTSELRGGSPAARWWSVVIAGALGYVGCVYIYTGQCRLMMKPQAQKSSCLSEDYNSCYSTGARKVHECGSEITLFSSRNMSNVMELSDRKRFAVQFSAKL